MEMDAVLVPILQMKELKFREPLPAAPGPPGKAAVRVWPGVCVADRTALDCFTTVKGAEGEKLLGGGEASSLPRELPGRPHQGPSPPLLLSTGP